MKVTWILADGRELTSDVKPGLNMMEAAVANSVPGVVKECGGSLCCCTPDAFAFSVPKYPRRRPLSFLGRAKNTLPHAHPG